MTGPGGHGGGQGGEGGNKPGAGSGGKPGGHNSLSPTPSGPHTPPPSPVTMRGCIVAEMTGQTEQLSHCCASFGIGCVMQAAYNCFGTANTTWVLKQQLWCCRAKNVGCASSCTGLTTLTTTDKKYCCDAKGTHCPQLSTHTPDITGAYSKSFRLTVADTFGDILASPRRTLCMLRWALLRSTAVLPDRLVVSAFGVTENRKVPEPSSHSYQVVPLSWHDTCISEEGAHYTPSSTKTGPSSTATPTSNERIFIDFSVAGDTQADVRAAQQNLTYAIASQQVVGGEGGLLMQPLGITEVAAPSLPPPSPEKHDAAGPKWLLPLSCVIAALSCVGGLALGIVYLRDAKEEANFVDASESVFPAVGSPPQHDLEYEMCE